MSSPSSASSSCFSVEEALYRLPPSYTTEIYQIKCDQTYQHIFEAYYGEGHSVYQSGQAAM